MGSSFDSLIFLTAVIETVFWVKPTRFTFKSILEDVKILKYDWTK